MRHAKKTEFILDLEKPEPYEFTTVQEAYPKLSSIAEENNLNLTNPDDYKTVVAILRG